MKKLKFAVVALVALVAGEAAAVKVGGSLYVRSRDTKVFEKPDLASKVVATLQPGDEVTWAGADAKTRTLHGVSGTAKGKAFKGFTLQQNLTPNKPQDEVLASSDGKKVNAQAFASSGAATKALSDSALNYAAAKPDLLELTKGVLTAEAVALSVKPEEAQAFVAKRTGGGK